MASSKYTLPAFTLKKNKDGHLSLFPRSTWRAGEERASGTALLHEGVVNQLESPAGFLDDVLIVDQRGPLFYSRLHLEVVRLLCGDDGVAALRSASPCTMIASAWLMTGGDGEKAAEGLQGLLHTIERAA